MKATIKELLKNKRFKAISLSCLLLVLVLGVGLTLALVTDVTNALTNTFGVEDLTTHIEENVGTSGLKEPVVVNDGSATAFIRARVTVSPDFWDNKPENISLQLGWWDGVPNVRTDIENKADVREVSEHGDFTQYMDLTRSGKALFTRGGGDTEFGWYYNEADGWYYYNQPVEAGECTTPLFDAIIVGENVKENFDITIYQEAVASKPYLSDDKKELTYDDITSGMTDVGAWDGNEGKSVVDAFADVNKK